MVFHQVPDDLSNLTRTYWESGVSTLRSVSGEEGFVSATLSAHGESNLWEMRVRRGKEGLDVRGPEVLPRTEDDAWHHCLLEIELKWLERKTMSRWCLFGPSCSTVFIPAMQYDGERFEPHVQGNTLDFVFVWEKGPDEVWVRE